MIAKLSKNVGQLIVSCSVSKNLKSKLNLMPHTKESHYSPIFNNILPIALFKSFSRNKDASRSISNCFSSRCILIQLFKTQIYQQFQYNNNTPLGTKYNDVSEIVSKFRTYIFSRFGHSLLELA